MIRVLMCSSDRNEKGGINSVIDQLMNHKWNKELQVSYLATHKSGNVIQKILFFLKSYITLFFLIKKDEFDVIHIHMSYKGSFFRKYMVASLCKKYDKKIIIHLHGSEFKKFFYSGSNKLKRKIIELFTIADYTIALGEEWKDFIMSIAPKANVIVINNSVKIPVEFKQEKNEITTFLFLGALIKRKGVIDLLNAAKRILDLGYDNFKILVAGSGVEENDLRSFCEKNGLINKVDFLGWINNDEKEVLLKKSDILVLPSYNEGLPIAILEAMSYGLPIISTNVGSIDEAVINNVNGFLFEPGNIELLKNYFLDFIVNDKKWYEFSEASRKIAKNKFADTKFFYNIEKLYFELQEKVHPISNIK
ncbi:TPA: glycosyltransferase family 4 protein [Clostridium perfringens]|nr:glycosyltransferase family 4 protein [Clostridium perfringens]